MKKHIYWILIAASCLLWSCDDSDNETAGSLKDVTAEPRIGSVVLKWTNPSDDNYYYTEVSYVNPAGETVRQQVSLYSVDSEKGAGHTAATIAGLTGTGSYDFTLTPYTTSGHTGEPASVSCSPEPNEMAYKYVASTAKATPAMEGAIVKWSNEWKVPVTVEIKYKDLTGSLRTKTMESSESDSVECLAFINPTTITVTSSNAKKEVSSPTEISVTPLRGEIPWSRMKVAGCSNYWADSDPWANPSNLVMETPDPSYCWHSNPDADKPAEHYVTIDLGEVHEINWVETVRRLTDYSMSPDAVGIEVSSDNVNYKTVGKFTFDKTLVYNHAWNFDPVQARYVKLVLYNNYNYVVLRKICVYYSDAATHFADDAAAELQTDPDDDPTVYPDIEYMSPCDNTDYINNVDFVQSDPDNPTEWTYKTTGDDPFLAMNVLKADAPGTVLVFQYKCSEDIGCEFFWMPDQWSPAGGRESLFSLYATQKWTTFKQNFAVDWDDVSWTDTGEKAWNGTKGQTVRFDIGDGAGVTVQIRNMHWRAAQSGE